MSFRWENSACCTSPPTLSLPKVSCQLINHLCPVLSAKKKPTSTWILGGKGLELVPLWGSPLLPGGEAPNHSSCRGDSVGLTAQCNTPASLWLVFIPHPAMAGRETALAWPGTAPDPRLSMPAQRQAGWGRPRHKPVLPAPYVCCGCFCGVGTQPHTHTDIENINPGLQQLPKASM